MRKITQCLNPTLISLCERAIELESLTTVVQNYFKSITQLRLSIASFNKGCLVILVEEALAASELRYHLPALRDHLRSQIGLHQLVTVKLQMAAYLTPKYAAKMHNSPKLSDNARSILLSDSLHCQYEPLREALIRLASNTSKR